MYFKVLKRSKYGNANVSVCPILNTGTKHCKLQVSFRYVIAYSTYCNSRAMNNIFLLRFENNLYFTANNIAVEQ